MSIRLCGLLWCTTVAAEKVRSHDVVCLGVPVSAERSTERDEEGRMNNVSGHRTRCNGAHLATAGIVLKI